ncbi:MAG: hypothetical protein Tsb0020_05510 [Haliangiales bacterium]
MATQPRAPPMPHDSHDALVKAIFGRPEYAADELRAVLPSALTARLDLRTLSVCPGSFVSEELTVLHYILQHSGFDEAALKQFIDENRNSTAKENIVTTAEMLMEKGSQQTARRMLTKQLRLRFGDLPDVVIHNIENAPLELIERWVERFATHDSLEDIFA